MAHQTVDGGFGKAHPVSFKLPPEIKDPVDTSPSDIQPPGVDEDEPQSLEEALMMQVQRVQFNGKTAHVDLPVQIRLPAIGIGPYEDTLCRLDGRERPTTTTE